MSVIARSQSKEHISVTVFGLISPSQRASNPNRLVKIDDEWVSPLIVLRSFGHLYCVGWGMLPVITATIRQRILVEASFAIGEIGMKPFAPFAFIEPVRQVLEPRDFFLLIDTGLLDTYLLISIVHLLFGQICAVMIEPPLRHVNL
jgi:hypothetical protein